MNQSQGYVHIYTGNGKGKTSAALGLVLRAAGAGMRCLMIQFMKGREYSELRALARLHDLVFVEQYGSRDFCMPGENRDEHREFARDGYDRARAALSEGNYSVVVLDEIITAMKAGLLSEDALLGLIGLKRPETELVLTGRGATEALIARADLVTEMVEVKHYYSRGVPARRGIEE
ncbi:MAG TPA: cob(I)yrinic acid a,c-diamide adenosyltransferase [Spirochaetota bacterium]|nr:cob(I)yrinic acid a,c-diamide adenosyltransferase [Spirochaetota bacterium]HSA15683.1 cob(I)yrinic acid a,c-diamide adenosyltransferase [Spirochaetota bacterium]